MLWESPKAPMRGRWELGFITVPEAREYRETLAKREQLVSPRRNNSIYWYKFTFNGEAIRESTRQKNQHTARQMEAAHRASLAKGEVGIREKKATPTMSAFCG